METYSNFKEFKSLARAISLVENDTAESKGIMLSILPNNIPTIGITGPPGAGKSTLLNAIIGELLESGKKIGLVLIDPSSPFHFGALLGDRLRMSHHFTHPNIFIRSIATRGSLGGLSDKIIEITEVMKAYPFDYIFIETVGVGQSEVEIAGIADTTIIVLVPESGDSIQAMKAGLMEIADIFVINKYDRPGAEMFHNNLSLQLHINGREYIPVLNTIASESNGIKELIGQIEKPRNNEENKKRKIQLIAEKSFRMIQRQRMAGFDKDLLKQKIAEEMKRKDFSIFKFVSSYNK